MENSLATGAMAVFAVSGSVVFLALQAHKRLLSDFMKKIEFEIGSGGKDQPKKKVRFADDVVEHSPDHKAVAAAYPNKKPLPRPATAGGHARIADEKLDALPLNWQVLYKGIIEYRALRGHN